MSEALGVDIGGSSLKIAIVDVGHGRLTTAPIRLPTPRPATPEAIADSIAGQVGEIGWRGPIGCAFPGPLRGTTIRTATNLDPAWVGIDGRRFLTERLGHDVELVNDADAAGLAEMAFGAGMGRQGTVVVLTFGTGIGSAVFVDGHLAPNTELGEVGIGGTNLEGHAAARLRTDLRLSYPEWSSRVSDVLRVLDELLAPELFVVGGTVSASWAEFAAHIHSRVPVAAAAFTEHSGVIGAGLFATS